MLGFGSVLSGAQTTMHDWRMARQLLRTLLFWVMLTVLATLAWSMHGLWRDHPQQVKAAWLYARAMTIGELQPDDTPYGFTRADGRAGTLTVGEITANPAFAGAFAFIRARLAGSAVHGALASLGVAGLLVLVFRLRGRGMRRTRRLRGAGLATPKRLARMTARTYARRRWWWPAGPATSSPRFALAGIPWPQGGETRHTMIVGTTGSGKTVAMSALLDHIRRTGGKAVIYDKMGSFIPHYYRPERDIILNPLDARSHDWDLFGEVRHEQDLDMIAAALIPAFKDTADPFWTTAARQLFASGAAALWKQGNASLPLLIDRLLRTNLEELAAVMEGMVEQAIIDPENTKTALSVRAILTTAIKPLSYLPPPRRPFSVRDWVESADDSFLFLSSDAVGHERRKALIATQLEVATAAMLSGSKHPDRRLWFIIDELPTLERIPSLTSGLRESRQFGGCFVIGTQVVSELREIYGRNEAETISGNCNARLILATPDMATAEWCAGALGRQERERVTEGRSFGSSEVRDGVNISRREDIRPVVLPSEIMELQPLEGYVRIGGGFPVARVRLEPRDRPVVAAHLVPAAPVDPLTGEVYETGGASGLGGPAADMPEGSVSLPGQTVAARPAGADPDTARRAAGINAAQMAADAGLDNHMDNHMANDMDDGGWYGVPPSGPVILPDEAAGRPPREDHIPLPEPRHGTTRRRAASTPSLASKPAGQGELGFGDEDRTADRGDADRGDADRGDGADRDAADDDGDRGDGADRAEASDAVTGPDDKSSDSDPSTGAPPDDGPSDGAPDGQAADDRSLADKSDTAASAHVDLNGNEDM